MQAVYIHMPHTNQVSRIYSVAAILWLQFMVQIMLFPTLNVVYFTPILYTSTFRSTCALPNMFVFCSSLISYFPSMFFGNFLNNAEMVPVVPVITDNTSVYIIIIIIIIIIITRGTLNTFL